MHLRELGVRGAYEVTPVQHPDERGTFLEWFREDELRAATGRDFGLAQANCSVSMAGVLRGLHFADVPPGQAKYVTCVAGSALDFVVDLRTGSPTFGAVATVELDTAARRAVFVPEGVGHAFLAHEDGTTVSYLCTSAYDPAREHTIDALDPELGLPLPTGREVLRSPRDEAAPTVSDMRERGLLPTWDACLASGALGGGLL